MTAASGSLIIRVSWKALESHQKKIWDSHFRTLFANDPQRGTRMTAEAVGSFLDYSKHRITDEHPEPLLPCKGPCMIVGRDAVDSRIVTRKP